ncbi:MAG: protein kinase [Thermoanaerobaculia bacterium]
MSLPALVPGTILGGYRLIEPVSGPTGVSWIAERVDSDESVSLRIFPRSLPPDEARRAAILQAIGSKLPIEHPSILSIRAASAHEDALLIETAVGSTGPSLASLTRPLDAADLVPLAASLVAALDVLHTKGVVHGTLNPSRVVKAAERWIIAELNPLALLGRPDRGEGRLLGTTDSASAEELRWRAPEQLSNQPLDRRSDIFSLGALLYRAATGVDPFGGRTPEETSTAVLQSNPRAPKEINPGLTPPLVALIGACLRKDPTKRPQTATVLMDELARIDAGARDFSARASNTLPKNTVFLVAELPYIELLERTQPRKAMRNSAKMQQFVSEAVLLFDGKVLDSLGNRMIATLPDPEAALSAVEQAAEAIAEHNAAVDPDEVVEPAMLVHRGAVVMQGATARGRELEIAQRVIPSLEPGQILISAPVLAETGLRGKLGPAGSIEGIEFFALSPSAASEPPLPRTDPPAAPAAPDIESAPSAPPRRLPLVASGAIVIVLVAVLGGLAIFLLRGGSRPAAPEAAATPIASSLAEPDRRPALFLGSFTEGIEEPNRIARARAIEAALRRMLASVPELRLLEKPVPGAARYGARAAEGASGLIAFSTSGDGPEVELVDAGAATAVLARWIAEQAGVPGPGGNPEAIGAFVEAVQALEANNRDQALAALRRSTAADPDFQAAQRLTFELSSEAGDIESAIPAAEAILRLRPEDHAVREKLFDWYRSRAEIPEAIRHAIVLAQDEQVAPEILHFLARRALSAGDEAAFQSLLARVEKIEGTNSPLHAPDLLAAQGRFASAAQQYYQIEPSQPENPWLAFKIGRIAVIRHSTDVTELEIEKLARLEPRYLHPLLQAYLAAESRDRAGATAAIERAAAIAAPDDAIHTASAEIWAILADHRQILASLRQANEAREPTLNSILSNPLFAYLSDDREFAPLRAEMQRRQGEIREALKALR